MAIYCQNAFAQLYCFFYLGLLGNYYYKYTPSNQMAKSSQNSGNILPFFPGAQRVKKITDFFLDRVELGNRKVTPAVSEILPQSSFQTAPFLKKRAQTSPSI